MFRVRSYPNKGLTLLVLILASLFQIPVSASTHQLTVSEEKSTGYKRNLFKHWIDEDKNGCNTRAEVLIEEAIVKPKIGPKCKLSGGKWLSAFDGKTVTNAAQLDVDHMVPLAEAWRSGAWQWKPSQRQAYANDLENAEALIAVTASSNRVKGDKDPSQWLPAQDKCKYIRSWILVKQKYLLSVDTKEAYSLNSYIKECAIETPFIPIA